MDTAPGEVTRLLGELRAGNREAESRLLALVYAELRRLAAYHLGGERQGHTLQPTALVNETYLKLFQRNAITAANRVHFFALASQVMRRILVDHARAHRAAKRGGGESIPLDGMEVAGLPRPFEVLAVDEALDRLEALDPRQARIVELRFFGGLSVNETADVLGLS